MSSFPTGSWRVLWPRAVPFLSFSDGKASDERSGENEEEGYPVTGRTSYPIGCTYTTDDGGNTLKNEEDDDEEEEEKDEVEEEAEGEGDVLRVLVVPAAVEGRGAVYNESFLLSPLPSSASPPPPPPLVRRVAEHDTRNATCLSSLSGRREGGPRGLPSETPFVRGGGGGGELREEEEEVG